MQREETTERLRGGDDIPSLISDLTTEDGNARREARARLARIGRPAVASLTALLEDHRWRVKWEAAKTLAAIADPASARPLARTLNDENSSVRWVAAEALIALGPSAIEDLLKELIRSGESARFRSAAHHVLLHIEEEPERSVVAPVARALEDAEGDGSEILEAHRSLERLHAPCTTD